MQKTVVQVEQRVKLPQTIYSNKNGIELVESNTFCSNCAAPHKEFLLRFSYLDFTIYLKEEEYKAFLKKGIDSLNVDSFYDLYKEGYHVHRASLCFILMDAKSKDPDDWMPVVARIEDNIFREIYYDMEKFDNVQSIIDYSEEDFETDFLSGDYDVETTDMSKK
jgi:hypothetical protein